ncbi:MAG TPA: anthranilate phosphoribosyltransferase [Gemmatimonadaceae bacterium]|nr:anthranilate phosphoribosyltransferase [Gemmatimonadaceae bacterium]
MRDAVKRLARRESLTTEETAGAFREVMAGDATPALVAALLVGLRVKGETAAELAGAAQALRDAMTAIDATDPEGLVDTCGTGGGTVTTFNISTAAALVAAGAGARVAKHGNRSFRTRSGSADVLEALGVAIDIPAARMLDVLHEAGIVFMFAPTMHPAMRHVGPVRGELGIETLMNMIGPLANPARAGRQVVGVSDPARADLMAGALATLGSVHALVVHGAPGMDEVSPLGPTAVVEVQGGTVRRWEIDPAALGFTPFAESELAGAGPQENAAVIEAVLRGAGAPAAEAAVVLNASAALYTAGRVDSIAGGVAVAIESIRSGAAMHALERLRRATRAAG